MEKNKGNRQKTSQRLFFIVMFSILISISLYSSILNQSHADYFGIVFGSEAEVKTDGGMDIWQVEKARYSYIAMNQTKPEVDLRGLIVTRNLSRLELCYEYESVNINATGNILNYIYNYSFEIPLTGLKNITYTFVTNQTFTNSEMAFKNWTDGVYYNESIVHNITKRLLDSRYYSTQNISIQFNITHSEHFVFWFNITFEFWIWVDQVISIQITSISPGNSNLNNSVWIWIFLDTDLDDKLNFAIRWIYDSGAFIYSIANNSFTLGGWWNGAFDKVWTGVNWREEDSELKKNFGTLGINQFNVTIPSYLINLTSTVRYGVWSVKKEAAYDWWDALPDDPYWQLSQVIPSFTLGMLGVSLLVVGIIFLLKKKSWDKIIKME
ncbi:MAG: hypothetical protein ACTSYB_06805 [Candidatus Helarchaeota archaeon]